MGLVQAEVHAQQLVQLKQNLKYTYIGSNPWVSSYETFSLLPVIQPKGTVPPTSGARISRLTQGLLMSPFKHFR